MDLYKLEDVIFGITQKLLYIASSNSSGNTSLIKEFFLNFFL